MRIKKRNIGITLAAIALLTGGLAVRQRQHAPRPAARRADSAYAVQPAALKRLEAVAAAAARQRLAQLPEPVVPWRVREFRQAELKEVLAAYREMLSVQGLYSQHAVREQAVARILKTPHGTEIAARSLSDPRFAREAFGAFQAEARFFSIQVLRAAAQQGDEGHLVETASAVAQSLDVVPGGNGELDPGRSADLRDLVHAYIDVKGTEAFASGDVRLVKALGYTKNLSTNVKQIYDEALFMRLKHEFGRESAAEMTSTLLDG